MARIEKTVFISYRRKDISWALAVYQYLTSQKYDVFFDFSSIPSGDFEQIILSNIRARAHFILILTPTALDRCNESGDWVRREIETAIQEKRNIVPLFFDDFNFGSPSVAEKITGSLVDLSRYNGLNIPSGYFMEAMERMRSRYLNVPLNAVLHPVSREVQEVVKQEQTAANTAVLKRKAIEEKTRRQKKENSIKPAYVISAVIFAVLLLGIFGVNYLLQSIPSEEIPTPPITSISTLGIGSTMISSKDGMVLVYVPAGEFQMGSNETRFEAGPVHIVHVSAFWIDRTEITNAMFSEFVKESGYVTDAGKAGEANVLDKNYDWQKLKEADWTHPFGKDSNISETMNQPVVHMSWNDAQTYCAWAGRRLPTEAEWEKASGWDEGKQQKFIYPWGNSIDCSRSNYWGGGNGCVGKSASVGGYESGKSSYGAFDMAGNVAEWVNSLLQPYPYSAVDGREDQDATGWRVMRGGSWFNAEVFVHTAFRAGQDRAYSDIGLGFRCARDE